MSWRAHLCGRGDAGRSPRWAAACQLFLHNLKIIPDIISIRTETKRLLHASDRVPETAQLDVDHLGYTGCSLWTDPEREVTVVLLTNRVLHGPENRKLTALRPRIHDAVWGDVLGMTLFAAAVLALATLKFKRRIA